MNYLKRRQKSEHAELDMTPMLDIVFIMLIFFIVTTSFVKDTGVEVNQPQAQTSVKQELVDILIAITSEGGIWIDNRHVDISSVRAIVARMHAENPQGTVIIQSDEQALTRTLVAVMDQVRMAGVEKIAIAAQSGQN